MDAGEAGLTRRVARLFTPYRGRLGLIGVAILVTSVLGIANPFLTKAVFDRALFVPGGPDLRLLFVLVGLMILIPMVSALIGRLVHATCKLRRSLSGFHSWRR